MQYNNLFISLCMIVSGDKDLLSLTRAINSAKDYVDEVCITTNGAQVGKVKKYCKENKFKYSHLDWTDDFAAQRNYNFSQASEKTDYILWLDSDDILVGAQDLRWLAEKTLQAEKHCVYLPYWYDCTFEGQPSERTLKKINLVQKRERLLRPGYYNWVGRLHETPIANSQAKDRYTLYESKDENNPIIAVMHCSSSHEDKMKRNLRIMNKQLEDEIATRQGGADPRTLLYLLKMYAEKPLGTPKDWLTGIEYGKEYLEKSGWDEERGACLEHMGICYEGLGQNAKAVECYHKAIQEFPYQPMAYLRLSAVKYNQGKYTECRHWLEIATGIDVDKIKTSGITNVLGMKVMAADIALKLAHNVDKNIDASVYFARKLYEADPKEKRDELLLMLENKQVANEACKKTVDLVEYYKEANEMGSVRALLENMPNYFKELPVFVGLRHKYIEPKRWGDKSIVYLATFGGKHFEQWDETNLQTGIGGSETAVIQLAQEWAKSGYEVTVYGDPKTIGTRNGVTWLPYYEFNPKDRFNIFIQWRGWSLANKIKANKFYVDLHDIFSPLDLTDEYVSAIDKIFVKSEYHRNLAPDVPNEKFNIISNGL